MASRALLVGGGLVAAGLAFAYVRKIGPFAPPETQIDPGTKITGGEGLSPEDLKALGAPPPAAPTSSEGGDLYQVGIRDYFKRVWKAGGGGVPYNVPVATIVGGFDTQKVSGGNVSATTASAFRLANMKDKTVTGAGVKIGTGVARGFMVNQFQAAIYLPDAGRLWGLVQAQRILPASQRTPQNNGVRDVDGFVTAGADQNIDAEGTLYGLGAVYAWDPIAGEWVPPSQLVLTGSAARYIKRGGGVYLEDGLPVYGYADVAGKRLRQIDLISRADSSRKKATPV